VDLISRTGTGTKQELNWRVPAELNAQKFVGA
jgi:hypothetical protein